VIIDKEEHSDFGLENFHSVCVLKIRVGSYQHVFLLTAFNRYVWVGFGVALASISFQVRNQDESGST